MDHPSFEGATMHIDFPKGQRVRAVSAAAFLLRIFLNFLMLEMTEPGMKRCP
jgi:hypothetical protein